MGKTLIDLEKEGLIFKGNDEKLKYDKIPFGIIALDILLGGGIAKKHFTLVRGPTNVGKSYLVSQIAVSVQKLGGTVAWIDSELAWDSEWMERCGINIETILLSQPPTGEVAFDIIKALMDNSIDLVVLDSIAGLVPTSIQEEDFSYSPVAWQARLVNAAIARIFPSLKNGSAFVAINQLRSSLGPTALQTSPGGLAQTFFAHMILDVRREGWIKEGDVKVGFDIEVRLAKSKVGGKSYEAIKVPFRLEGGIDILETYIREAINKGLIEHARAWFKILWNDEKLMGMNGLKKYFLEHLEQQEELRRRIKE